MARAIGHRFYCISIDRIDAHGGVGSDVASVDSAYMNIVTATPCLVVAVQVCGHGAVWLS